LSSPKNGPKCTKPKPDQDLRPKKKTTGQKRRQKKKETHKRVREGGLRNPNLIFISHLSFHCLSTLTLSRVFCLSVSCHSHGRREKGAQRPSPFCISRSLHKATGSSRRNENIQVMEVATSITTICASGSKTNSAIV